MFQVDSSETIRNAKGRLGEALNKSPHDLVLAYNKQRLDDDRTFGEYNISPGSLLQLQ